MRSVDSEAEVTASRSRIATEMPAGNLPFVSIVVPMRNEEEHVEACLRSLVEQTYPGNSYEIVVADGRSNDGSRAIVERFQNRIARLRLLHNPAQTAPSGMNVAIRASSGKVIIVAGAHATYPADFVENSVLWLERTGADVVGGPVKTSVSSGRFGAKLASIILSSPFGVGNSRFRTSTDEGYVDTVPFGAYRREIFDQVGLFNEKLVRNQDNDLSERIRRAGGKIYLTRALEVEYSPVRGFRDLISQGFRKSQWHALTLRENVRALGLRHLCPAILVLLSIALLSASISNAGARAILGAAVVAYVSAGFFAALNLPRPASKRMRAVFPFACFLYHSAYGLGTLYGMRHLVSRSKLSFGMLSE
jgi:glycosyltransferase involved in cell wall biosynthesis